MRCKDTPFYPYTQDEKLLFIPPSYPFLSFIGGEWNALFQQSATTTLILLSYYPCQRRKDQQRGAGEKENMSNRQSKKGEPCRICNPQGRTKKQNLPKFSLGEMGRGTALKPSKGRKARACLSASLKGVYHPTKET